MPIEYRAADADTYRMKYAEPHLELESAAEEIRVVDEALAVLVRGGILPTAEYDHERFLAHRAAVREAFEIPWTAISPRMQRLIYAVNAIRRPRRMLAAGIFCGNTFISNAGAGVGPGAVYTADELLGVEIVPEEAARAERNVRKIDPTGVAHILAADAVAVAEEYPHPIDLLYLDANETKARGKGIYHDILMAALPKLSPGALILAHNSYNGGDRLKPYFDTVRDEKRFRASANVILDPEGLEVTVL